MVETTPTGRSPHELREVTPTVLDCGHPYLPGRVIVGYEPDLARAGERVRTYRCRECGAVTYS